MAKQLWDSLASWWEKEVDGLLPMLVCVWWWGEYFTLDLHICSVAMISHVHFEYIEIKQVPDIKQKDLLHIRTPD